MRRVAPRTLASIRPRCSQRCGRACRGARVYCSSGATTPPRSRRTPAWACARWRSSRTAGPCSPRASGWPRLAQLPWRLLRCGRSVTPGQQLVDPGDLVVGDPAQHRGEPSLRVDTVQLGAFDQRPASSDAHGVQARTAAPSRSAFQAHGSSRSSSRALVRLHPRPARRPSTAW
jgi:hypothetical protein